MTEQYYFVCSIGPVQELIATARTSQDLWFGSWMLSELAKAAAKTLQDGGHTLIFPAPKSDLKPGSEVNVTNKVVALINGNPKDVGDVVWQAIEYRRDALRDDSFGRVQGKFDRDEALKQLEDLIEFYWAASPYDESKGDDAYKEARDRAEALLAARKVTRHFAQAHGQEGKPKSSLDGFRESVLPREPQKGFPFWKYKAEKGESLSGVDLLKRWGERQDDVRFVSTTDLAAKPFEIYLGERCEPLRQAVEALFLPIAERSETPGTLFYVDRLVQLIEDEQKTANFREALAKLFREHKVDRQPLPYYALLQADGDNMGKTITAQEEMQKHSDLSNALSGFAGKAKTIITEYDGVPVYVGGDDVLAYLPLHTALDCVSALNDKFNELVGSHFKYVDNKGTAAHPTLSAGLAIAHHLTPLSDVLKQARRAEKAAKQVPGKHGLVISLSKRSGTERQVTGKLVELAGRMECLIDFTRKKAISHGVPYELES
ncbi:MAG: type III-B CRISPR-associated protein Cas10/Cmr2, partial [Anaerolineales bacterium]